jgi:hypothetical protein
MRIGALLTVGLGLVFAAACSASTSENLTCTAGGGVCLEILDSGALPQTCGDMMGGLTCDTGYVCCEGVPQAPTTTPLTTPVDGSTPVETTTDAATAG